jgi:DNA polymerase III delta subunit
MSDLEKQVYRTINEGIEKAIVTNLTSGYTSNPLFKIIESVIQRKTSEFERIIEEAINGALEVNIQKLLKEAIAGKIIKLMVSKMEGEAEKQFNNLKSSPQFRAKMTLAIEQAVSG